MIGRWKEIHTRMLPDTCVTQCRVNAQGHQYIWLHAKGARELKYSDMSVWMGSTHCRCLYTQCTVVLLNNTHIQAFVYWSCGTYFCVMQSFVFYLGSPEKIEVFLHFNKTTTKWNPQSDLGQEKEILSYFTCHLRDCHFLLDLNDLHEKEESEERRSWRNKIILAPPGSLLVISTAGGRSNFLESKGRSEQNGNLDEERNERQIVMERLGKAKREAGS